MSAGCRYDEAGPWDGGQNCAGDLKKGTKALGQAIVNKWRGYFQGYNCRPNTADPDELSMHGTGRGLDVFPVSRIIGDTIARWLVANHKRLGVQYVIWWHRAWSCDRGWHDYTGPVPHTDHLHVEQDAATAERVLTHYFKEGFTIMDKATKAYMDAHFGSVRTAQARAAKRQLTAARTAGERHRAIMAALGAGASVLAEIDAEADALRARIKKLDDFLRAEGVDPDDEDDEFETLTAPLNENPGTPNEGPED